MNLTKSVVKGHWHNEAAVNCSLDCGKWLI
jgi:hypothetical protein